MIGTGRSAVTGDETSCQGNGNLTVVHENMWSSNNECEVNRLHGDGELKMTHAESRDTR